MSGGQVLSADAIAALVDAAREGRLPEEAPAPQRRRRLRPVDFTRPTKFTADQERRLKRSLEAFCRTASTRLSAELRVPLELEVINTSQLTWANAHAQVLAGSVDAIADIDPIGTRLTISAEPGLVLGAIELLLGGTDPSNVTERRLSDIDWALARHFFDRMLAQLSVIWTDMVQLELSVGQLETHLETAQLVSVSEPTLTFTMEARFNGVSSTIVLLLPWSAIAPVADRFAQRDDAPDRGEEEIRRVRRAVGGVDMTVRAEVASVELPIEQVLALQAGDVLRLDAPAEAGITLYARQGARPPGQAGPQRQPPRRADHRADREAAMSDDPLIRLGQSSSEAISGVLEMFAPGKIVAGDVSVVDDGRNPMDSLPLPAVATNVSYVDGVTGGNVFVMTLDGARKLAAAMMGMEQPEDPDAPELSELELSAVSEAMNQMMASAAMAISSVLGTEVEIGTPETKTFTEPSEALDAYHATPHAVRASFTVCGEPCRLVQLVPNAFVVRMTTALDELGSELAPPAEPAAAGTPAAIGGRPSLAGIPVRVWAELGRARMPSAQVVGLPSGAVVELNQAADEPIDLYVNGTLFATGRLMVVDGTDWAVRIETVLSSSNTSTESQLEVARWPESW